MIYWITLKASKKTIIENHGKEFYYSFKKLSLSILNDVISKTPYIGKSIFSFNYEFCPAYIAWYKAYMQLGLDSDAAGQMIWKMNEKLVQLIPKIFMKTAVNIYIGSFRKKAKEHEKRWEENSVHPYDWKIRYREINDNVFEVDIYECGMIKLCKDFDALGLFPSMCRMDYLFSHYMGNGFERTKTLGDGCDCCNCRYILPGECEWTPEKGFTYRK